MQKMEADKWFAWVQGVYGGSDDDYTLTIVF